jgi:catechol 2,3-dioxygenase-like lactoylglutathione lyase family enzyme
MKRFHVHVSVRDIEESVRFYSTLFSASPSVLEREYAKWMLDDPRVNFAISTRSGAPGIDHLGIEAETADELAELGARLDAAGQAVVPEAGAECCHARSDKFWSEDPQGTRWEAFHTIGRVATYHGAKDQCDLGSARGVDLKALSGAEQTDAETCCDATTPQGVCCAPKTDRPADAPCCGPVKQVVEQTVKKAGCDIAGCKDARH